MIEDKKKVEAELKFIPQYTDLDEIPTGESVRALIFAQAGGGKTEFAGSAGDGLLLINVGRGIETLKSAGFKKRNPHKIKIVDLDKILTKDGRLPTDQEMIDAISDTVYHATRTQSFRHIAIDDMTEYRFYALWRGMEIMKEQSKSKSFDVSKKYDLLLPAVQDFGAEMGVVEDFLRWFCNDAYEREYNIIVTAHTRNIYKKSLDSYGKPIMGEPPILVRELPGFTGQTFPDYIPRLFSIVGQIEPNGVDNQGNIRTRLRLVGGTDRCVKHRYSGVLPEYINNATFDKILEAIKSNRPIDTDGKIK